MSKFDLINPVPATVRHGKKNEFELILMSLCVHQMGELLKQFCMLICQTMCTIAVGSSGTEPEPCYWKVAGSNSLVCIYKCLWARY